MLRSNDKKQVFGKERLVHLELVIVTVLGGILGGG